MKKPVYALRDELVGFLSVNVDINDQAAMRNFRLSMAANSAHSVVKDYSLYRLGDLDVETGLMDLFTPPRFLCRGLDEGVDVVNE